MLIPQLFPYTPAPKHCTSTEANCAFMGPSLVMKGSAVRIRASALGNRLQAWCCRHARATQVVFPRFRGLGLLEFQATVSRGSGSSTGLRRTGSSSVRTSSIALMTGRICSADISSRTHSPATGTLLAPRNAATKGCRSARDNQWRITRCEGVRGSNPRVGSGESPSGLVFSACMSDPGRLCPIPS